jgi:hypothetical protein
MVKSEARENSFQGALVDGISSTPIYSQPGASAWGSPLVGAKDKNHGFAHPSSTRKESDCMRPDLSFYTPTSVFDGLPPGGGKPLQEVSRYISVSDGLPNNTKAERSEGGLAYYESARALHTQLLCEGDSIKSRSPTIQADTPSPSRLKGKFFLILLRKPLTSY